MNRIGFVLRSLLAPAAVLALGACSDASRPEPLAPSADASFATGASATLLECESTQSFSTSGTIDLLGGTLSLTDGAGGVHEVVFPANAVLLPTNFSLTVPASKYVEVRVIATDVLTGDTLHVVFPQDAQPTLAISYKRCTRSNTAKGDLHLYNIDEATDAVLEGPFGTKEDNTTDPRVKGKVPHFSDYALGTP